eukprot:scaffold3.g6337.t1
MRKQQRAEGGQLCSWPPWRLLQQRNCAHPRAPRAPPVRAALYSLPESAASWLHTATAVGVGLAVGLSALPILTGDARERNEERARLAPAGDQAADSVRWSVMAVLSFIPFVNPMAWVFAALDDESSSTLYYTFALLYALPYLASGLQLDGYAVAALLAGAAHVERIAMTEPAEVELPEVLRALLRALPSALRGLGRYSASLGGEVGGRARSAAQAQERRPERKLLEEQSREARMQLEEFDRRRRERERQRARRPGDGGDGRGS